MQRVFKETFPPGPAEMAVDLPEGAEVVHFAEQNNKLCFWFIAPGASTTTVLRRFRVVGTGVPIRENATYIGTALVDPYVVHLFEIPTQKDN